jgi:hypothetical protein
MATRSKSSSRRERETDSMEALKPLVVLVLFGTILYGAYSVVQKGPTPTAENAATSEAPPFAAAAATAPQVELPPTPPPFEPAPIAATPAATSPAAAAAAPPAVVPPPVPAAAVAVPPPAAVSAAAAPPPAAPSAVPPVLAAAAAGGVAAAVADQPPTYLNPQSSPPPAADELPPATDPAARPDRYATLPAPGLPAAVPPPATVPAPDVRSGSASSAAFASAWADAHEKLTAGRYAEALSGLSVWYDDPSLGLEESQRLEDLLGQLAGTVIYSQQDLLLPPHVVAPGETLATVAAPLGVWPQLLAKINGIDDPLRLVPGEHLKVIRGPFDAVVSISRRRLSLQLGGSYAGSFPVLVGRQYLARVGGALPVAEVGRDAGGVDPAAAASRRSIVLGEGLAIEAVDDPTAVSDNVPPSSLIVSVRDLDELLDILGPGSRVLVRQ